MLEAQLEPNARETFFYVAPQPAAVVRRQHVVSTACYEQMHPGVYRIALACWMGFLGVFVLTFLSSASALFMIAIDAVYAVMFFGIPWLFYRMSPQSAVRPRDFFTFMSGHFDTLYGPIRASEALLQVILVPLLLGIGGIAIGFIIQSARMVH